MRYITQPLLADDLNELYCRFEKTPHTIPTCHYRWDVSVVLLSCARICLQILHCTWPIGSLFVVVIKSKLFQNAAFPEALETFSNSPHSNFSLMLCMVNCHLYANACVYALHTWALYRQCIIFIYIIIDRIIITIFHTVCMWCARICAQ